MEQNNDESFSSDEKKSFLLKLGIFALCFGYFASYIPYSSMIKMITKGLFPGMNGEVAFTGFEILGVATFTSFLSMFVCITLLGWWKYANKKTILGITIPWPRKLTFLAGICVSGIIITTTLSYSFGISIVYAMLLMRGGVIIIGAVIDTIILKGKRIVFWPSWVAAGLSLTALFVATFSNFDIQISLACLISIFVYLLSYFVRLVIMADKAKDITPSVNKAYFVEEQMVANPILFFSLCITALVGGVFDAERASILGQITYGFTSFLNSPYVLYAFFIGFFSYGTGLFGSLILLDSREHTFSVPANRITSLIAGLVATYFLSKFYAQRSPNVFELIGFVLIVSAIFFLRHRTVVEKQHRVSSN